MCNNIEELPKKEEYIFSAIPFNEEMDLHTMGAYQVELFENDFLQEKHAKELLNYAIYTVRKNKEANKKNLCPSILDLFFRKLGLLCYQFNMGPILGEDNYHQLCLVEIPIRKKEKVEKISFILDPHFRQLCLKEKNRFEIFFEKSSINIPDPGYFLSLTKEGTKLANNLITYGYFEASPENIKLYCDAFHYHFKPKEKYENQLTIGKIAKTNYSGSYYREEIEKNKKIYSLNILVETPIEILYQKLNKGLGRFSTINKKMLKKYRCYLEKIKRNEMNSYSLK